MGKKKSGGEKQQQQEAANAKVFVLRVPMHCRCDGCADKIRAGVKDLTLNHGIEALDQSALWTKGELGVVASPTADPQKLLRRLKKATGKSVDLLLPKPPQPTDKDAKAAAEKEAAALELLLRRSLLQQQQAYQYGGAQVLPGVAAWGQQQPAAVGYGGYPWAAVQQQQPEAYPSSYGLSAPYPAATGGGWGAYAYPQGGAGAYGGGWPF